MEDIVFGSAALDENFALNISDAALDADMQAAFEVTDYPVAEGVEIRSGPKPEDWDRLRPIISRLYLDERMNLKDVAVIMRKEYDHKASESMYKKRFHKWGIGKNRRSERMRQTTSRRKEQVGSREVLPLQTKYWQLEGERPDPWVEKNAFQSLQNTAAGDSHGKVNNLSSFSLPTRMTYDKPLEDAGTYTENAGEVNATECYSSNIRTTSTTKMKFNRRKISNPVVGSTLSGRQQLSPLNSASSRSSLCKVPWAIAPPQSLLVPEKLLFYVKSFTQASLDRFRTDEKGYLVPRELGNTRKTAATACYRFSEDCSFALSFLRRNSFVEARQILSKACEKSRDIIEEAHPKTLTSIFSTYLQYKNAGFVEWAIKLIENLRCVAVMIQKTSHAVHQVMQNLLLLDQDADGAYFAAWNYCGDIFEQRLQPWAWVNSRLAYIGTVSLCGDREKAERLLGSLSTECEQSLGKSVPVYWEFQCSLATLLFQQEKFVEAENVAQHNLQCIENLETREQHIFAIIRTLLVLSYSQYFLSKYDLAEKSLRRCIEMSAESYGENDTNTIYFSLGLETWLREWGRHEEAAALAAQRSRFLGSPIIKELLE